MLAGALMLCASLPAAPYTISCPFEQISQSGGSLLALSQSVAVLRRCDEQQQQQLPNPARLVAPYILSNVHGQHLHSAQSLSLR
jgi:hypothetical protein